jgi:hypothetical protein
VDVAAVSAISLRYKDERPIETTQCGLRYKGRPNSLWEKIALHCSQSAIKTHVDGKLGLIRT